MYCPKCHDVELKAAELQGVRIDTCPVCGGSWFDRNELRQARNKADSDLAWMEINLWKETEGFHVTRESVQCPSCGERMASVGYADTGVQIDYCMECGGIWLDKGEFSGIVNVLENNIDNMTASDYLKESVREIEELISASDDFGEEWKHFRTVMKLLEYRVLAEHRTLARIIENFRSPFA
jgi:Zn-finger nucleic acid-binding protein